MDIGNQALAGKTILEVGCGLDNTTRRLAGLLAHQPGARLIVTDISDRNFTKIRQHVSGGGIDPEFLQTDACDLNGIESESVDYLVCNCALCEISSRPGRGCLPCGASSGCSNRVGSCLSRKSAP